MSDHFSGPMVMGDPSVDITDFYAFPSPERPGNVVLIMDVFPMATAQSCFSDVVTHRFRLRPLTRSAGRHRRPARPNTRSMSPSATWRKADRVQSGQVTTSCGRRMDFAVGMPTEQDGMRVFAGLASDPFFMDVEAALRTDMSGKLSFDTATNTVELRDVLAIAVELPCAPILERFEGATLVAAVAENTVTRRGKPIRIERVGRPEMKNVVLANPIRDPRTMGVELRDLYNREDAFALSPVYRSLYESRMDANLAFFDGLDNDDGVADRGGRAAPPARPADRRLPGPRSRARLRAGRFPRDRTRSCSSTARTPLRAVAGSMTTSSTSC